MIRLKDLICSAYTDNEFSMLLVGQVEDADFDYDGLAASMPYEIKVLETVRWANRYGKAQQLLWLTKLASNKRPLRTEFEKLVKEIEALIQPPVPVGTGGGSIAGSSWSALPPELAGPLGLLVEQASTIQNLARDLRMILRTKSYKSLDLPGQFHLSESAGERLAAVLALEKDPHPAYLRWLSERVAVEKPLIGFMAAQALITAGFWLDRNDLNRISKAISTAIDLLDGLADTDEQPAAGFDIVARKRQLQTALSLVEVRSRNGRSVLPPADFERFLSVLISSFDRDGFDGLLQRQLQTSLKWLANPNEPIELIVINVALTARDKGWERELLRAAYEDQRQNETFATLHRKYVADGTV